MGIETSLLVAAAAAAAGGANQYFSARKQDKEAARGIQEQQKIQREADERISQQIGGLEGSDPAAERKESLDSYMTQLRRNRAATEGATPGLTGASDRYDTAVDESQDATQAYSGRVADLLSRIDAPAMQRRGEARGFGDLASDLGGLGRRSEGEDFLTRLRVRSIKPNPWIDALSSFGLSYAGSRAGTKPDGGFYGPPR